MKLQKFARAADINIQHLTDRELFELCRDYGTKALMWRKKFAGLLPEVNRRKLFFKKGCGSIFEFAAKLAGMSEEHVRLVLNLEKKFDDKPVLKALLVNGEISANKLARVASIATIDNQEELAVQLKILPRSAINTLVRDEKYFQQKIDAENQGLAGHSNVQQNLQNASGAKDTLQKAFFREAHKFQIADDVQAEFDELHAKGIDVNELLRAMLKLRKEKIAATKQEIGESIQSTTSRYIAACIRKILKDEHGDKCTIAPCQKLATTIHHTQRFSLSHNHDPRFLAPMCKEHHAIAHSVDQKYQRARELAIR